MPRRPKPKFELSSSSNYESDLEAAYEASPSSPTKTPATASSSQERGRRLSVDSDSQTRALSNNRANGTIHEHVIYDEAVPLVNNTPTAGGRRPHAHRINSFGYGTVESPTNPKWIQVNHSQISGNGGGSNGAQGHGDGLKRQESILKLTGMINDRAGEFEKFRMPPEKLKTMKKKIREFYEAQNELLDGFAEVDEILDNTQAEATTGELAPMIPNKPSQEREDEFAEKVKLMINVNVAINVVLLAGKIAVVLLSNSMSLVASTVDSAMDLLSTMIIFATSRLIDYRTWKTSYQWPTGKKRLEPVGVIIFSVFMVSAFIQVFIESLQRLLAKQTEAVTIPLVGGIVMGLTIAIKLGVWLWCRATRNTSVEALTQDAENDIVFNFFSIVFPFVGQWLGWHKLDAIGGCILSLYIVVEWVGTLLDNTAKLTGRRASPAEHQRVAYLLSRFSPLIIGIQHLSLYHAGDQLIVETDVILPASTPLTVAHNASESCQFSIEQLTGVDRCFVHVDVTANQLSGHLER